jgi:hypothetical protein
MIQPVNALTPKVMFRGDTAVYENPVNRKMERKLALMNAGGLSVVAGALTTVIARSYTSSWRHAGSFGLLATGVAMMFLGPRFLYKSGINSYAKEQEMDVFTREKEVQKKLLSDVNDAIDAHKNNFQDKLESYSKTIAKKSA